jgi:hypothetical protein
VFLADGSIPWIGVDDTIGDSVGLAFNTPISLNAFTIEGCFPDRSSGLYTFQYTTVANPNATTPDASWISIGEYTSTPGGTAFPVLDKTLFTVAPITNVTCFRIVTYNTWPNYPIGMNIVELEVYGAAVPEPSLLALALTAAAALALPRRRIVRQLNCKSRLSRVSLLIFDGWEQVDFASAILMRFQLLRGTLMPVATHLRQTISCKSPTVQSFPLSIHVGNTSSTSRRTPKYFSTSITKSTRSSPTVIYPSTKSLIPAPRLLQLSQVEECGG